jgi:hypothetical protein
MWDEGHRVRENNHHHALALTKIATPLFVALRERSRRIIL